MHSSEHCKRLSLLLLLKSGASRNNKPPSLPLLPSQHFSKTPTSTSTSNSSSTSASLTQPQPPSPSSPLFDVDANLTHKDLASNAHLHITNAQRAGVRHMINPGSSLRDSQAAIALAKQYPSIVYACVGIHPYCANEIKDIQAMDVELRSLLSDPLHAPYIVGLGECGLDYSDGFPKKMAQKEVFLRQLVLAREVQLPVFLHERLAHKDFVNCLESAFSQSSQPQPPLLVHCFTGTEAELEAYIRMGCYVSISGSIFKSAKQRNKLHFLRLIPKDRIMVETDAPYLGFTGCRKQFYQSKKSYPNVPSALPLVVAKLAKLLETTPEKLSELTYQNAKKFFKIS